MIHDGQCVAANLDGQCVAANLRDLNDDDRLARYYTSSWFETCHNTLDLLGEMLRLDDVVSEDDTTQTDEVVLLMKLAHPLIVTEGIDKLRCIIMLCYFLGLELFLLLLLL